MRLEQKNTAGGGEHRDAQLHGGGAGRSEPGQGRVGVIDVFHLALGGSRLDEIDALDGVALPIVHVNDVPRTTLEAATDALRVFPGEGDLPLDAICERLGARGFDGTLSLELFNPEVWKWGVRRISERSFESASAVAARCFGGAA